MRTDPSGVVGVVPAAGRARRLGEPAASKEAEPVYADRREPGVPRPVCWRLLAAFEEGGIDQALAVTRPEKADLALALSSRPPPPAVQVILVPESPSAPFTVSVATRAAGDSRIALGFPDVLWSGADTFRRLLARLDAGADVALGLFPPARDYPTDGVVVEGSRVERLTGAEEAVREGFPTWTIAVWRPAFSRLLESVVDAAAAARAGGDGSTVGGGPVGHEIGMSEVVQRAIETGLRVEAALVSDRPFLDIGDPARLARARRDLGEP